jgi:hypothetical protein
MATDFRHKQSSRLPHEGKGGLKFDGGVKVWEQKGRGNQFLMEDCFLMVKMLLLILF